MKKFLMLAVLVVALFALPSLAMASGWSAGTGGVSPHTGYSATTNYCKVCHAVHEAENVANTLNGEKLLRSSAVGACDYCHVSATGISTKQVYNSNPGNYGLDTGKEHTLSSTVSTTAPDSGDAAGLADPATDYTFATFGCVSCHSVHSAGTFQSGLDILKANPYTGNALVATTPTTFCADCHDNNDVYALDTGAAGTDQVSHYMGAPIDALPLASASSATCISCHNGGAGTAANSYPHMTTGWAFLEDTATGVALDGACLNCHANVGSTY